MKNLLIVFAWLFCCHIGAQPWFEHWENGKNYEIKENYTSAIDAYTKALETGAFYENFHVRYDRAMCFMMVEDYISALKDLEIFLEKSDLKISDKLKALRLKGSALFFLKHTEEVACQECPIFYRIFPEEVIPFLYQSPQRGSM